MRRWRRIERERARITLAHRRGEEERQREEYRKEQTVRCLEQIVLDISRIAAVLESVSDPRRSSAFRVLAIERDLDMDLLVHPGER